MYNILIKYYLIIKISIKNIFVYFIIINKYCNFIQKILTYIQFLKKIIYINQKSNFETQKVLMSTIYLIM